MPVSVSTLIDAESTLVVELDEDRTKGFLITGDKSLENMRF